jgi:hypothetical protein
MKTIIEYLYKKKIEEFYNKLEDRKDPEVIYVTDLVGCFIRETPMREQKIRV